MPRIKDTAKSEILRIYNQKLKDGSQNPTQDTVNVLRGFYTGNFVKEKIKEIKK